MKDEGWGDYSRQKERQEQTYVKSWDVLSHCEKVLVMKEDTVDRIYANNYTGGPGLADARGVV